MTNKKNHQKPQGKTSSGGSASDVPSNALIGRFFHSIKKETGQIEWQGVVVGSPQPEWYLVQLFEWMMGEPNVMRLVKFDDMLDWLFYADSETMIFSYEHGMAREGGKYRKRLPKEKEDRYIQAG